MIQQDNFKSLLKSLGFVESSDIFSKKFDTFQTELRVDFKNEKLIYPENDGFVVNEKQTCNFKQNENFVVFECVCRLLSQGYKPNHIELEPKWQVGHGTSGGRADILIKDNNGNALLIIECKTAGSEFTKAWNITQIIPTQLFSYFQQERTTQFIALYASDFINNRIVADYYLINVTDNETLLKNNPNLKSYKDASTVKSIYQVWSETYKKEYATQGLFENTQAYHIGKDRYSISDLKTVSSKDIQGKYHEFATIMRQHNVSGRENAFDKLVNLFLCKVVDETNNANELKFYWKGVAYDDPFSLQDRLNHLYKVGMKKFLGEDITYIEDKQIDDAFSVFRDKPNMTKELIEGFFKELKFFTNNDFAFIDVHNEELFYQNFEVLLKVVKMLQDIRLTGGEDNQFLGDMFEGFLDQGIKQSEGQFFTPMPIVKFIVNSLPIEEILSDDDAKAIDYACGSGHFLNEVANNFPKEKHKNIYGIEKEYRLSKVAKVSAFMYAQDDINIIYADALSSKAKVKEEEFSLLVANPPYSVKGFLETLSEEERNEYELINTLEEKNFTTNNSIECFFIERTKQLLKSGGVAGIILPSSILSNGDKLSIKTREILLKYFDILAIAEFGNGTFGKTGTNTVTLFLQKRASNPDMAKHLQNMCDVWFSGDFSTNELFRDKDLLQEYCNHIEVKSALYKTLLKNKYDEKLFEVEIFAEYKKEFEKLTVTKNRKKKKSYNSLTEEEKNKIEKQELLKYISVIERDKLYYFCLAYLNKKEVIILKAPLKGKSSSSKKVDPLFLGYEWSNRKGDEGIKYITSQNTTTKTDEEEGSLENILNLNNIQTPLYNPQNISDTTKINTLIKQNFLDEIVEIPEELSEYISKARVVDMLDFSQKEFGKSFSLNPKRNVEIKSKWELVKLGEVVDLQAGSTPSRKNNIFWDNGTIKWLKINDYIDYQEIYNTEEKITQQALEQTNIKVLPKDTVVVSIFATIGRVGILKDNMTTNQAIVGLTNISFKIKNYYLMYAIKYYIDSLISQASGSAQLNINSSILRSMKIPLPPLEIQEKIIQECQKIDDVVAKAKKQIEKAKQKIEESFNTLYQKATNSFKLSDSDSFEVSIGKRVLQKEVSQDKTLTPIYSANVFEVFGYIDKDILKDFSKPSVLWGIDGDWMVNHIPTNRPFYPTDHCGVLRVKNSELNSRYVAFILDKEGKEKRFSRTLRASIDRIKTITIKAPSKKEQDRFALEVEKLEQTINQANEIIQKAPKHKEEILKGYLE
jgi:type I restriction-modification system DNA methylase subunit/restriction endonuclease S subunit